MKLCLCLFGICVFSAGALAQQPGKQAPQSVDLTTMKLEDLMNIKVTSASKKEENLFAAPAAIYVITGADIRRGGYSSIPDALRSVPGLYVVQQSANIWIVSARGFSGTYNDKMLVLIDGRLVYTPTYGGVYWDVQDPPLEDIDRIEVIRGPGGTLWGANAVNGVINIITKKSANTQGALVATSAGVNEGYAARVRYGGKIGENFAYRIYGTGNDWRPTVNASGAENYDTWSISQGGARFDWNASGKDTVEFDGQGYSGRVRTVVGMVAPDSDVVTLVRSSGVVKGGHLLGRWKHSFNDRSDANLLAYCDWTARSGDLANESRNLCDIEFQHNYSFAGRQSLTWGGSVMTTEQTWINDFTLGFSPPVRRDTTYSGFLQYDIALVPGKVRLIAGSKFEHNDYTGFEYQPQIRVVWTPGKQYTFWAAFSRAVRTPTRIESDARFRIAQINPAPPPPTFLLVTGNPNMKSEVVLASELGFRYAWKEKFSLDAAAYYNRYTDLLGGNAMGVPIVNPSPFYVDVPVLLGNVGGGQSHGLELSLKYNPVRRWTLSTGITELRGNSAAAVTYQAAAFNPAHQVNFRSRLDLTRHLNFDAAYYYYDVTPSGIPPINRVDLGVSSTFRGFTFSVWGRNLQQARHLEAIPQYFSGGEIRRSVTFKLTWESNPDQVQGNP